MEKKSIAWSIWVVVGVAACLVLLPAVSHGARWTKTLPENSPDYAVTIGGTDENGVADGDTLWDDTVDPGSEVAVDSDRPDLWQTINVCGFPTRTEGDVGPVKEVAPGFFQHIPVDDFLREYGSTKIPEIYVHNDTLYYTVDLVEWAKDPRSFSYEDSFQVIGGTSPDLPGFEIGTGPLTFSTSSGWVNNSPYTGFVQVWGELVTTPSTPLLSWRLLILLVLLLAAGATLLIRRRRPGYGGVA